MEVTPLSDEDMGHVAGADLASLNYAFGVYNNAMEAMNNGLNSMNDAIKGAIGNFIP